MYQGRTDLLKRFGAMRQWVSDQGANFPNQMVDILQRTIAAQHHFTAVYTPWVSGTAGVASLDILKRSRRS